ncbi:MAG: tRNA adenosine(34) deaminase TadA [Gammaproteobacteria bacterium]|nr:MAG: tRNA adenosine(34) deaminase TadA [Gammaproteobacteria bacterium]
MTYTNHQYYMQIAIEQAHIARDKDEVPVGAVVVLDGEIVGVGHNSSITASDSTSHAEINAIRAACEKVGNYRLPEAELFVTLEPCSMCVGAMIHARIKTLVFGASDPKTGAAGGVSDLVNIEQHKHKMEVVSGVLDTECRELLQNFFKQKRLQAKANKTENKNEQ